MRRDSAIQIPLLIAPRGEMFPIWRAVTAIGLPITLSTGSVALGMGSVNRVLTEAYGNVAIAGWMISLRIEDIAFGTLMGGQQRARAVSSHSTTGGAAS